MRRVVLVCVLGLLACSESGKKNVADLADPRVDGANGQFDLMADLVPLDMASTPTNDLTAQPDLIPQACTTPAECDDGLFCNGPEQCENNVCVAGLPPLLADTVDCTDDTCDEANDLIVHTPNDSLCPPTSLDTFCIASGEFAGRVGRLGRVCDLVAGCGEEATTVLDDCTNRETYPDVFSCGESQILVDRVECQQSGNTASCIAQTTTDQSCAGSEEARCTGSTGEGNLAWEHDFLGTCEVFESGPSCVQTPQVDFCTGGGRQCQGDEVYSYVATCDAFGGCGLSEGSFEEGCNFDPTYICVGETITEQRYGCLDNDGDADCGVTSEEGILDCPSGQTDCIGGDIVRIDGCSDGQTTCNTTVIGSCT